MSRAVLERHQVWFYLAAVIIGLLIGSATHSLGTLAESLVWPVLALLLLATFTQMPLASIPRAFADGRFLAAALAGNFLIIPVVVWALVQLTPDNEVIRLGLFLVLLVPCTDWFITFTQLGGGDGTRATVLAPITLIVQLLLLPLYLWLLTDVEVASIFALGEVWPAFVVVLVPLGLAAVVEQWASNESSRQTVINRLGWWPVPLLSIVIAFVAIAHSSELRGSLEVLPVVTAIAVGYLVASLILARVLASGLRLPIEQGRTLAFSFGTRNSFIVLPFALSLPAGWDLAALVVVMQSLVELFGMIFYLWFVPNVLFRSTQTRST